MRPAAPVEHWIVRAVEMRVRLSRILPCVGRQTARVATVRGEQNVSRADSFPGTMEHVGQHIQAKVWLTDCGNAPDQTGTLN
jgi:hypothetical protein